MTIRDFCAGGLFLEYGDRHEAPADIHPWPARLAVRFEDPSSGQVFHTEAHVVRDVASGLAVSFDGPRLDVVTILSAIAEGQTETAAPHAKHASLSEQANHALDLCRREALGFAERVLPVFTGHAIDILAEAGDVGGAQAERDVASQTYISLRQRENEIISAFIARLREHIDGLLDGEDQSHSDTREAAKASEASIADLELIDTEEFEDWLNRSEIVNQSETRFAGQLERLTRRLGELTGRPLDQSTNPFGPASFSEILGESLPVNRLPTTISRQLYRRFGRDVLDSLGDLYEELNRALREQDILPGLEEERPEIRSLGGSQRSRWVHRAALEEMPRGDGVFTGGERFAGARAYDLGRLDGHIPGSLDELRTPSSGSSGGDIIPQHDADVSAPQDGTNESGRAPRWLGIQRLLRSAQEAAARRSSAVSAEADPLIDARDKAAQAETPTPQRSGTHHAEQALAQLLAGASSPALEALGQPERDRVEIVAEWFVDIATNPTSTPLLRDWSHALAPVALDRELHSGDLLASERRPIHEFLDQWDRVGVALTATDAARRETLRERVDEVLERVQQGYREAPQIIAQAASELSKLADAPLEARAANLRRITDQCEGSKRLEQARGAVSEALDERVAGGEIPSLLDDFIRDHWHHVLVLVRLRSGADSEHWQRAIAVVDRLLVVLGTSDQAPRPIPDHRKVFAYITKQLEAFGRNSADCAELVAGMRRYADAVCRQATPEESLSRVRARRFSTPAPDDGTLHAYWSGLVKLLTPGQWLIFQESVGAEPAALRLQWLNHDRTRFVFADRSGITPYEFRRPELAKGLESARFRLSDDLDAPLTQRQWRRKIESAHESICDIASRDSTTRLLNRKALLRDLKRVEAGELKVHPDHAVAWFRCGDSPTGSDDHLISRLGALLADDLGAEDRVARTDSQSFAIFMADRSTARAEIIAEEKRRLIEAEVSPDSTVGTRVGVGLVSFRFGGLQGPDETLRSAERAALEAAQAGGDRVVTVRADEGELETLRANIKRAAQLDAALAEGHLQLRAQRIQGVNGSPNDSGPPLREVLIAIGSGEDSEQLMSPAQFIPAAERFGRMADVDRWVVRHVLEWCRDHPRQARGVEAFTINLAPASLQDTALADYLEAELARTGVAAEKICFELSEPVVVENLARAADLLLRMRELGSRFALADVGTGGGAFHYLKNLPVDYVKIDGSFVREVTGDDADATMVRSINDLAHYLGKRTIAEYVENEAILERMEAIGVDYVQGFGIGYPEPLDSLPLV